MNSASGPAIRASVIHELSAALRRGDREAARAMFDGDSPSTAQVLGEAERAMRERRWGDAAWLFERVAPLDNAASIKHCLCRNLGSLQQHRPEVHDLLLSLPQSDHCGIGTSATQHPTIVSKRKSDGLNISLSPDNKPLAGLAAAWTHLKPVFDGGHALALCGLGDGYLFHQLAQKPPKLFMDTQQCVFLLEPDGHVLLTALMIHDYTGSTGPIEQARFRWFIGPDWADALRATLNIEPCLQYPQISLNMGLTAADVQATTSRILVEIADRDEQNRRQVDEYYAATNPIERSAMFGEHPPRRPRVLLVTTRFSTVLQYATRDAADGFEAAGWDARVLIEPTAHHRILNTSITAALNEFRPDLVFQIDHQRQEHGTTFPTALPFVSWFQDHMPQLMRKEAGERIGPTDFVLTDAGPTYVSTAGYPARQMIGIAKLTSGPDILPKPALSGDDIIFVSNASWTREALLKNALGAQADDPAIRSLVTSCVDRAAELFAAGHSLSTFPEVAAFVKETLADLNLNMDEANAHSLTRILTHPVCDAFYRHQALRWTAEAAEGLGLKFGLYGNGWDAHRDFARYARGPVAPGREVQELMRRAAINLQLAPYLCLHQRLLDGICGGAFFLIRQHVADVAPQAMLDLLESHCGPKVACLDEARACVPPPVRDRFERLAKECRRALCPMGNADPIEMVRLWQEARLLVPKAGVLPRLEEVSFADAASLRERIERFVGSPDLREEVMLEQRQSVIGRLTYAATMPRIARRIGELLVPPKPVGQPIKFNLGFAA